MSEAVFGLVGVILGSVISIFGSWFLMCCKRERDARHLASRITYQLDEYVLRCVHVAHDYGPNEPDDGSVTDKSPPSPPVYPNDVDWSSIDDNLMYRILALPCKAQYVHIIVSTAFYNSSQVDIEDAVEEQQLRYSELGIEAYEITKILRNTYRIPHGNIGELYGEPSHVILREKVDKIEEKRSRTT